MSGIEQVPIPGQPGRTMNVAVPAGNSSDYVTYGFTMPKSTHQVKVTCAQADCEAHLHGWETRIDLSEEIGQRQAAYIVNRSGRRFSQEREGDFICFTFTPGQTCFREHFKNLDKDPVFYRKGGDWRSGGKLHVIEGQRWLDDFIQTTEATRKNIENGS